MNQRDAVALGARFAECTARHDAPSSTPGSKDFESTSPNTLKEAAPCII